MLIHYYTLTKPGIIYGNAIAALGGFFLASKGDIDLWLCAVTILGISFVIASGCVLNNYIDQDIDRMMERTKGRVLVRGLIRPRDAVIYGSILGLVGIVLLAVFTNALTLSIALFGLFFYVAVYSLWSKRYSIHATIIGSISGAVPPVVGYVAVSNTFDLGAVLLFIIMSIWQMPHSYAIAIYRLDDYLSANIPVLPVRKGLLVTKVHMLGYIIAFVIAALLLYVYGYVGYFYLGVISALSLVWLGMALLGFRAFDQKKWAKKMFLFSIVVMVMFSVMIAIDPQSAPMTMHEDSIAAWA
jgi:heme o synthase